MGYQLRALARPDVPAWAALLAEAERVDDTGENIDADDLLEDFDDPGRDQRRDFMGAWAGDDLVGFCTVMPRDHADAEHRTNIWGAVHPEHRRSGVGTALVGWAVERAREAHAQMFPDKPLLLQCNGLLANEAQSAVLAAAGFTPQRWEFGMARDLTTPVAEMAPPGGLRLVPYTDPIGEATRLAHNDAFADHWGFVPWSPQMWQQWVSDTRAFRPGMSRLLVEPSEPGHVVGYLISYEYVADEAVTGIRTAYVGKVGVRRAWRGRGAASALLSQALRDYRADGYGRATLDVDADNPTGALGVYQRLGFRVTHRWVDHVRRID